MTRSVSTLDAQNDWISKREQLCGLSRFAYLACMNMRAVERYFD